METSLDTPLVLPYLGGATSATESGILAECGEWLRRPCCGHLVVCGGSQLVDFAI